MQKKSKNIDKIIKSHDLGDNYEIRKKIWLWNIDYYFETPFDVFGPFFEMKFSLDINKYYFVKEKKWVLKSDGKYQVLVFDKKGKKVKKWLFPFVYIFADKIIWTNNKSLDSKIENIVGGKKFLLYNWDDKKVILKSEPLKKSLYRECLPLNKEKKYYAKILSNKLLVMHNNSIFYNDKISEFWLFTYILSNCKFIKTEESSFY